jgi:hypothetical protein
MDIEVADEAVFVKRRPIGWTGAVGLAVAVRANVRLCDPSQVDGRRRCGGVKETLGVVAVTRLV